MKKNLVQFNEDGNIIDILSGKILLTTPEEVVRQQFIGILNSDYGYPKELMLREVPVQHGSKIMKGLDGADVRADIVVYNSKRAAIDKDQGNVLFVVECKKPKVDEGYAQLVSYIFNTSAVGGVWTNGNQISVYKCVKGAKGGLEESMSLPRYGEDWGGGDAIPAKSELTRPKNVRFLLSTCHNKLYGRGMENADFDLTMDMVRILLAKIQDEMSAGDYPKFWITDAQYKTVEGRRDCANAIQALFREYADQYPDVFESSEKIQVSADCIAEAAGVLKDWSFAARTDDADGWDLMGETYEQFTHINLKRQQGQFFTNRLVIDMMVKMLDPEVGERTLDPAGGGGGFATGLFRYLRRKAVSQTKANSPQREQQLAVVKNSVFLVEIASRLVKIAKCAMLLTGDGQSGMTRGNSLGRPENFDKWIQSRCAIGKTNAPAVIATNPPFSGQKVESQISDKTILRDYVFGHTCKKTSSGKFVFGTKDSELLLRQAPELLFIERCVNWLKPGGRLGIVLPKGILDNISYEAYRDWLLERCEIRGIVTLHKDTFQPDTGVRTCVMFLQKPEAGKKPRKDYDIFMAISQRIGQDSKGNPVFVIDANGRNTDELNHDLGFIAECYEKFRKGKDFKPSEYVFSIKRSEIKDHLNINPQHYLPKLNETLNAVLEFDNKEGWSTTTVGQLESGIKIYIGPRWSSSSLRVNASNEGKKVRPFLTANAALELRRMSVKWFDLSKASKKQLECIKMLEIQEGDILISRSGTIGKMTYATKDLARNYIVSDDLVRIRVRDEKLRAYLVSYFASTAALSLMLLDEYGSVQQHLQPRHIQEMIVPVPDNWKSAQGMINAGRKFIAAMEKMSEADKILRSEGFDALMRNTVLDGGGESASEHRENVALGEAPDESDWEDRMAAFEDTEG